MFLLLLFLPCTFSSFLYFCLTFYFLYALSVVHFNQHLGAVNSKGWFISTHYKESLFA